MVVTAHRLASEAGVAMLGRGGNAIDAAVAAAFAVGVVEPMMSGVGGGGAMTIWLEDQQRAEHVEFYASAGADPDYALDTDSLPSPERGVAVPGTVAGLLEALERFGSLPRAQVVEPAIRIARDGFPVHGLLARAIAADSAAVAHTRAASKIFLPGGTPLQPGDPLRQPALARTLQAVAEGGRSAFYDGPLADTIVASLIAGGSRLARQDFAEYRARFRRPLCGRFRGHTVLSAPPPLAGIEVVLALNLLELADPPAAGPPETDGQAAVVLADVLRAARSDRRAIVGDPDASAVPVARAASRAYATRRTAAAHGPVRDSAVAGDPWDTAGQGPLLEPACAAVDAWSADAATRGGGSAGREPAVPSGRAGDAAPRREGEPEGPGETTHIAVVDASGNAVSLTYTLGRYFGTGAYVAGFFLNSANHNFSEAGPNARRPRRTPASSTAPTLVLEGDDVRVVVGSPASGRIPPAIVLFLARTLEWGIDPATAVAAPRMYPWTTEPILEIEQGFTGEALAALRVRGYTLRPRPPNDMYFGGVAAITVDRTGRRTGVADPRREGVALAR